MKYFLIIVFFCFGLKICSSNSVNEINSTDSSGYVSQASNSSLSRSKCIFKIDNCSDGSGYNFLPDISHRYVSSSNSSHSNLFLIATINEVKILSKEYYIHTPYNLCKRYLNNRPVPSHTKIFKRIKFENSQN